MLDTALKYTKLYFTELFEILIDMAPWLILGFLIAGVLHVFFPGGKINRLLGDSNTKSVFRAALFGVPLPLCSCGVIPTGISIYKNGASKGSAVSFLISTPQTGVDSIMVTYSLLGLPFAIIRPIVAFFTGIAGGILSNKIDGSMPENYHANNAKAAGNTKIKNPIKEIFRYAFVEFLADIAKWLIIGLAIAALIAVVVPDDFFASYIQNEFLGMFIILVASIPVYVCATSSVPIAAVLLMKGLSPGAALVFLMAGPATNAATISVIGNSMGKKTLITYMATIIAGALLSGWFMDTFLPRQWFLLGPNQHYHEHSLLPQWLMYSSALLMVAAIANIYLRKWLKPMKKSRKSDNPASSLVSDAPNTNFDFGSLQMATNANTITVKIKGMNCSHCKANVENAVSKISGVKNIEADVDAEQATLRGQNINLDEVKKAVEAVGYKFMGEV